MPVLTDVLAERIDKPIDAIAESNKESALINASLVALETRISSALSVARWGLGLLTLVVMASAPAAFGVYRDVAQLQGDVAQLKQSVNRIETKIDRLGRLDPFKIEAPRR
jgi:hypothetical protein